ncbi:MAG: GFA family protein [Pseudomonadota bacterium]
MSVTQTVVGGCHCGAIRFEVELSERTVAHACNCSICIASGFVGVIVPESHFRLVQGEGDLTEYRFNTGVARHLFCKHCGVKSFYRPRSNPDGVSVNIACLSLPDSVEVDIQTFDGQNWERHAAQLAHLSMESA